MAKLPEPTPPAPGTVVVVPEVVDAEGEGHMHRGHKGENDELLDEFGDTELMGRDRDHQGQGEMPDISKLSVVGEIVTRVRVHPPRSLIAGQVVAEQGGSRRVYFTRIAAASLSRFCGSCEQGRWLFVLMVFQSGSSIVLQHYEKLVWRPPLFRRSREGVGFVEGRTVGEMGGRASVCGCGEEERVDSHLPTYLLTLQRMHLNPKP